MDELSDPVAIGVVLAPHGVRGTLRVRALGAGKHFRKGTKPVVAGVRRRIFAVRQTPKGFLLDLEGIQNRHDAKALRDQELSLDREELDAPEEGEFYVADLVGLTVVNDEGEILGSVEDTFETAAHEVLVVRVRPEAPPRYVPFTHEHVPEVDLGSGRVLIRPPEE